MGLLWILMSGVNYLLLLLCSDLTATGSTISPRTIGAFSGSTSEASKITTAADEKFSSTTSPAGGTSISNGKTIQAVSITINTASALSTGHLSLTSDSGRIGTATSVPAGITLSANSLKTPLGVTSGGLTQRPPATNSTVIIGNTLSTVHSSFATVVTPLVTRGTQPSSSSSTITLLTDNTATASAGVSVGTGTTIPGTKTTRHPGKQLLKSWEIILISLAITTVTVAGFIGCCHFCRASSASLSITSLP